MLPGFDARQVLRSFDRGTKSAKSFLQGGTGGVARTPQDKMRGLVDGLDFGLAGDGTGESTRLLRAMNRAVELGVSLELDGTKTYTLDAEMTFPAGLRMNTNGATFTTDLTTTGDTYLITMGDDTVVDELNVTIPTGKRRDRCVLLDGDDIQVGKIVVTSVDQQANSNADDGAVQVLTGARNRIGLIRVANYDRPVIIAQTTATTIGRIEATSWVRSVYLYDNVGLQINGGKVSTASPNATGAAGHNGLLMGCNSDDAQRDVWIRDFVVEDATEHGMRVGGPYRHRNIHFEHCTSRNCGGNGFKVLGTDSSSPTSTNTGIYFDNCMAEDVGTRGTLSATNRAGFMVKFCDGVQITSPIVRKQSGTYSAAYGVFVDGATGVTVANPRISGTEFDGILMWAADGNISDCSVNGGYAKSGSRDGLRLTVDATRTMAGVVVTCYTADGCTGKGFTVGNSGTLSSAHINMRTNGNTGGAGACNSSNVVLQLSSTAAEIATTALSGINARNGSWFDDGTTLNIRKAGSWTAL